MALSDAGRIRLVSEALQRCPDARILQKLGYAGPANLLLWLVPNLVKIIRAVARRLKIGARLARQQTERDEFWKEMATAVWALHLYMLASDFMSDGDDDSDGDDVDEDEDMSPIHRMMSSMMDLHSAYTAHTPEALLVDGKHVPNRPFPVRLPNVDLAPLLDHLLRAPPMWSLKSNLWLLLWTLYYAAPHALPDDVATKAARYVRSAAERLGDRSLSDVLVTNVGGWFPWHVCDSLARLGRVAGAARGWGCMRGLWGCSAFGDAESTP